MRSGSKNTKNPQNRAFAQGGASGNVVTRSKNGDKFSTNYNEQDIYNEGYTGKRRLNQGPPSDQYLTPHLNFPDVNNPNFELIRKRYEEDAVDYIIRHITNDQRWPFRILKWTEKQGGTSEILWSQILFHDSEMTITPEESVARLQSNSRQSFRAGIVRKAQALRFERRALHTMDGRTEFAYRMKQISNSIEMDAMDEIVTELFNVRQEKSYLDREIDNVAVNLQAHFQSMLDMTGSVNKRKNGVQELINKLTGIYKQQNRNDGTGNMWLVPQGTLAYIKECQSLDEWRGIGGNPNGKGFTNPFPSQCVEVETTYIDGRPERNPSITTQTFGLYTYMNDEHLDDVEPRDFRMSMLDTQIMDGNRNELVNWSFKSRFGNLGFYENWDKYNVNDPNERNKNPPTLSDLGKAFLWDLKNKVYDEDNGNRRRPFVPLKAAENTVTYYDLYKLNDEEEENGNNAFKYFIDTLPYRPDFVAKVNALDDVVGITDSHAGGHGNSSRGLDRYDMSDSDNDEEMRPVRKQTKKQKQTKNSKSGGWFSKDSDSETSESSSSDSDSDNDNDNGSSDSDEGDDNTNQQMKNIRQLIGEDSDVLNNELLQLHLNYLQALGGDNLSLYYKELKANKDKWNVIAFDGWRHMAPKIIHDDATDAVISLKNLPITDFPRNPLEKSVLKRSNPTFIVDEDDETTHERFVKADQEGFQWIQDEDDQESPGKISIYSNPYLIDSIDLPFRTMANTLTASNAVLFAITDDSYQWYKETNNYKVTMKKGSSNDVSWSDNRCNNFDFSIRISNVWHAISTKLLSDIDSDGKVDDELLETIVRIARSNPIYGGKKALRPMIKRCSTFPVLNSQLVLEPLIQSLQSLISFCLDSDDNDGIIERIEDVVLHHTNIELGLAHELQSDNYKKQLKQKKRTKGGSRTGGMSHARDFKAQDESSQERAMNALREIREKQEDLATQWEEDFKKMNEQDPDEPVSSVNPFGSNRSVYSSTTMQEKYLRLYQVFEKNYKRSFEDSWGNMVMLSDLLSRLSYAWKSNKPPKNVGQAMSLIVVDTLLSYQSDSNKFKQWVDTFESVYRNVSKQIKDNELPTDEDLEALVGRVHAIAAKKNTLKRESSASTYMKLTSRTGPDTHLRDDTGARISYGGLSGSNVWKWDFNDLSDLVTAKRDATNDMEYKTFHLTKEFPKWLTNVPAGKYQTWDQLLDYLDTKLKGKIKWETDISAEDMGVLICCFHATMSNVSLTAEHIFTYVKTAAQKFLQITSGRLSAVTADQAKPNPPKIRKITSRWCAFQDMDGGTKMNSFKFRDSINRVFENIDTDLKFKYSEFKESWDQAFKIKEDPLSTIPSEGVWSKIDSKEPMNDIMKKIEQATHTKINLDEIKNMEEGSRNAANSNPTGRRSIVIKWINAGFGLGASVENGSSDNKDESDVDNNNNNNNGMSDSFEDKSISKVNISEIEETIRRMKRFSVKDGRIMKLILENNIKPPIGYRNYRPTIIQDCGGSVLTTTDGSVGSTYYIPIDFLMGEQPDTHVVSGMLNLYYRAVIKQPDRIARIYNCVFQKYKGGWGDRPLNILDSKETEDWVLSGRITKDVLCTPQLMGRRYTSGPVDITGRYGDSLSPSEEDERNNFLPGSSYYIKRLGLLSDGPNQDSHARYNPLVQTPENLAHVEFSNTLCFRDHQQLYDTNKKTFSAIRTCKGHFGEQVGPGFVDTLNGKAIVPLSFNYRNENKMVIV
jgi:hypothetical protein